MTNIAISQASGVGFTPLYIRTPRKINNPVTSPTKRKSQAYALRLQDKIHDENTLLLPTLNLVKQSQFFKDNVDTFNKGVATKRLDALSVGVKLEGKEEYQLVRQQHIALMIELTRAAIHQLTELNNQSSELGIQAHRRNEDYPVFTNRVRLSSFLGCSVTAIHSQIQRLITIGFITQKVNHGTRADFELHISHKWLLWEDLYERNRKNQKSRVSEAISIETQASYNKEKKNNVLIEKMEFVNNSASRVKTNDYLNKGKNRQEENRSSFAARPKTHTEKVKKVQNSFERWRTTQIIDLYWFAVKLLYSDKTIYEGEQQLAIEKIEELFENADNKKKVVEKILRYKWAIKATKRYVNRDSANRFVQYPAKYFSKNVRGGLIEVAHRWLPEAMKNKREALEKNMADKKEMAYQNLISNFHENPSIKAYKELEAYVKRNLNEYLPTLADHFAKNNFMMNN